jgi:hypothetical protein
VQGTRPNAVSAFPQSISSARTQLNTITFTHLTQLHITILRAVLRVLGDPTATFVASWRQPLPLQRLFGRDLRIASLSPPRSNDHMFLSCGFFARFFREPRDAQMERQYSQNWKGFLADTLIREPRLREVCRLWWSNRVVLSNAQKQGSTYCGFFCSVLSIGSSCLIIS